MNQIKEILNFRKLLIIYFYLLKKFHNITISFK